MKYNLTLDQAEEIVRKVIYNYCKARRLPYKQMASDVDYLSPGIEALVYADAQWDETKGASLESFRYRGILLALLGAHKKTYMKTQNLGLKNPPDKKSHFPINLDKETIDHLFSKVELSEAERTMIELRFYENKSFEEIADEMKCSRQNVHQCLKRTIKRLSDYATEHHVVL